MCMKKVLTTTEIFYTANIQKRIAIQEVYRVAFRDLDYMAPCQTTQLGKLSEIFNMKV